MSSCPPWIINTGTDISLTASSGLIAVKSISYMFLAINKMTGMKNFGRLLRFENSDSIMLTISA